MGLAVSSDELSIIKVVVGVDIDIPASQKAGSLIGKQVTNSSLLCAEQSCFFPTHSKTQ